jgi:hypothetical protein
MEVTWDYGWKHMWGLGNFENSEMCNTLFIGIIRNELDWLNSFFRNPHHVPAKLTKNLSSFLFHPFYSIAPNGEIFQDHDYTKNNIFDMRAHKNNFLKNIMPTKVDKYVLFQYEDVRDNYDSILLQLKTRFNLKPKHTIFKNITHYKKANTITYMPKNNTFTYSDIQALAKERGMTLEPATRPDGVSTLTPV